MRNPSSTHRFLCLISLCLIFLRRNQAQPHQLFVFFNILHISDAIPNIFALSLSSFHEYVYPPWICETDTICTRSDCAIMRIHILYKKSQTMTTTGVAKTTDHPTMMLHSQNKQHQKQWPRRNLKIDIGPHASHKPASSTHTYGAAAAGWWSIKGRHTDDDDDGRADRNWRRSAKENVSLWSDYLSGIAVLGDCLW